MTEEQFQLDPRELPPRRWRGYLITTSVIVFALVATGAAYAWLNYADRDQLSGFETSSATASGPVTADRENLVSRQDFENFKQQTADLLRSELETQRADLKDLSDRVTALSAKLVALRGASMQAPQQAAPIAAPVAGSRQSIIAQRKKLPIAKPTGPISVGGAPLPAEQ